MTPENKIDSETWYVLQKIKEEYLRTKTSEPIKYEVKFYGYQEPSAPKSENEVKTLEKLEDVGAIKIIKKEEVPSEYYFETIFYYLKIIKEKFNELYTKFQKKYDIKYQRL